MEPALEEVCKDARIGKILIQTNEETEEPEVGILSFYGRESNSTGLREDRKTKLNFLMFRLSR